MKSSFLLGFAGVLALVISCSDSKSDSAPSADATRIGSDGGTVTEGKASVDVPKGALGSPVKIAVTPSEVSVTPPDGYVLAGPAIAFTPYGTTFEKPVTLTLPYSSSSETLAVLRLDDEDDDSWEVIGGGKFAKGLATLDVSSFSIYAVAAESAIDGAGGAGGMGATAIGGTPSTAGGAETTAGGAAPVASGDLSWSCDRTDTDGNGLRICSEYFYPKMIADLLGDKLTPGCPGPGNGVLGEMCDTSDAVAGCLTHDVDDIPGVTVTNWFYTGTKADFEGDALCSEPGTEVIDPR